MKKLTLEDIILKLKDKVFVQDYSKKRMIEGVKTVEVKRFVGEDGTFEELTRISVDGSLDGFPEFKLRQINRSKILPGGVKAWHIHFNQEDVWYVPPEDHMILGLWDLRNDSDSKDLKMRIVMGAGTSKLVYVPRGVAHGVVNAGKKTGTIIYFVNMQFNPKEPDEKRLAWDATGADFWIPEKG
ncbi:dTDP-4-dehydrorhamnose 3,5-epimerase family protein [Candidatus Roizmanbacteria bacterium]|nr:dTDP-4-dehydrorhamnose 3,5-epimerase family protein [Candidatus Roizmanbacteria bacterium]